MLEGTTVAARFGGHARAAPDRVAIDSGGDGGVVTYRELEHRMEQVAACLVGRLGSPPSGRPAIVGILTATASPLVTASLGIARAGMVSVALDPAYPPERRRTVAADAGVDLVLTDGRCGTVDGVESVLIDEAVASVRPDRLDAPGPATDPDAPSSILYTSGSTGVPKGVLFSHRARLAVADALPLDTTGPGVRSCAVDIGSSGGGEGVHLAPLLAGGTLLPFAVEQHGIGALPGFLRDQGATALRTVPTLLRHLLALVPASAALHELRAPSSAALHELRAPSSAALHELRAVALFGEQLTGEDVLRLRAVIDPTATIHNSYGSTETGVLTTMTFGPTAPVDPGPVPAGRPASGRQVVIHDDDGRQVAAGVTGRIVARGRALPSRYWGSDDSSAGVFRVEDDGTVTVVTGDLGHLDDDGLLHVAGREDDVVKIAGHRVALGEVEAGLLAVPGVREAAATARPDRHGVLRLIACVVLDAGQDMAPGLLRAALARGLPRTMLPDVVTVVDELPRLAGGKVDRNALPDRSRQVPSAEAGRDLPAVVRAAFAEALDRPEQEIGDDADFFDLGGDSLRAVQVLLVVEEALGGVVPPEVLLEAPTVATLATALARGRGQDTSPVVPVRSEGDGPPLFVLPGAGGQLWGARRLAERLPSDQPVYAIQAPEVRGDHAPSTVEELAAGYAAAVRAVDPQGPHLLFGFSTGGVVALEVARQLVAVGRPVGLVVLGDSMPPGARIPPPPSFRRPRSLRADQIVAAAGRDLSLLVTRLRERVGPVGPEGSRWRRRVDGEPASEPASRRAAADRQRRLTRTGADLVDRHHGGRYDGPVVLLRCEDTPAGIEADWAARVGKLTVHRFPGHHNDMLFEPVLSQVADTVAAGIAGAIHDEPVG